MKNKIDMEIIIPNQTSYLGLVGKIGEDLALHMEGFSGNRFELANNINVVLTEAVTNAIIHANGADPNKKVRIRISISRTQLFIRVYDHGQGFDLDSVPAPSLLSGKLEDRGRGIYIIRSLMDSVKFRKVRWGNVLEMKKRLGSI
ncbi:MAG: ATP-binding protein [Deltaproteobacteria bacterium]